METFHVPGIAVGIVRDGKLLFARGYGVNQAGKPGRVNDETLFGIASLSKAFTTAALGLLVEEGKIGWDDPVRNHIAEFRLYDPFVTEAFTIRDLLTHRSGLGLGAGDLMIFPDPNFFTQADIFQGLRYLRPVSSFRSKYDYDNLLYIVAGEIVARVSGQSWEEFVEKRLLSPLGMHRSAASFSRLKDTSNMASPHVWKDGKFVRVTRSSLPQAQAAGGMQSTIQDMSRWAIMLLDQGRLPGSDQKILIQPGTIAAMWTPQTIIPIPAGSGFYQSNFSAYGLGWGLTDVAGRKQVSHTGGLMGMVTQITLIPSLKLGILVFTNQEVGAAFTAISSQLKDAFLGIPGKDRVAEVYANYSHSLNQADEVTAEVWKQVEANHRNGLNFPGWEKLAGRYRDDWFGEVVLTPENGQLRFNSLKSPKISGKLYHFRGDTFAARWFDETLNADALVQFRFDILGKVEGMRMKAISPLTDFSFDFHDLDLRRVPD